MLTSTIFYPETEVEVDVHSLVNPRWAW